MIKLIFTSIRICAIALKSYVVDLSILFYKQTSGHCRLGSTTAILVNLINSRYGARYSQDCLFSLVKYLEQKMRIQNW